MNILIIGEGVLAYFLCRSLISKGHQVVTINHDAEECVQLARKLNVTVVAGDATRPSVLEDANVRQQDMVMAITSHDEDNLLICQAAAFLFGVRRVFAIVNDPQNEELFHLLGVREAFSVTAILSSLIEQRISVDSIVNLLPAVNGTVNVVDVLLPDDAPSAGTPLKVLGLPRSTLIAAVTRGHEEIIPNGETVLASGDHVLVVTRKDSFASAIKKITGGT